MRRIGSPAGAHVIVDGRTILNFGGCCYLGLAREPELVEAAAEAVRTFGAVSPIPSHYGFALPSHFECETRARSFFGTESAMYFASGYMFGSLALTGLADDYDVILLDESAHYSLVDGALTARKAVRTFRHRDPDDLAALAAQVASDGCRPIIATDGMFATYGSVPPLQRYKAVADAHNAWLVVDESHSFGCLGERGRGAVEQAGIGRGRVLAGGSMAKAFCAFGGLAVGGDTVIQRLRGTPLARGAAPGMTAAAAMSGASMDFMLRHPERLRALRRNVAYLKNRLRKLGHAVDNSEAPVASFECGSAAEMQRLQEKLFADGIFVQYSTYVGAGPEGVIRCAIFADHAIEDLDRLCDGLGNGRTG